MKQSLLSHDIGNFSLKKSSELLIVLYSRLWLGQRENMKIFIPLINSHIQIIKMLLAYKEVSQNHLEGDQLEQQIVNYVELYSLLIIEKN